QATASGASRVWWLTHESNAQAMLLYDRIADKSGFVQYRKVL
ncbi:MAG: GNAT family N-acetyltransferase, partial [Roseateles sp.]